VRAVRLDGRDVLPELLAEHGDELADEAGGVPRQLLDEVGAIPSYYLRYFYMHDAVLAAQLDSEPRAGVVARIERELLTLYRDPRVAEKPALLERRGGAFYSEAAIGLVGSLRTGDDGIHVVDVRNDGTLGGLADDDVVEVPVKVGKREAVSLPQPPLAPELLGLVQHVAAYERLTAQAAVNRDPVAARKALLAHPLIGQIAMVDELVDRLLAPQGRAAV
jgi:6-phospho-beta-glucosidase